MARRTKREALKELKDAVDKVTRTVEQEESGARTPGSVVGGHKVPWRRSQLEAMFPMVTFTPEENIPVTWNGIKYDLFADVPATVPSIIKDIYEQSRRATRLVGKAVQLRSGEVVRPVGVGALEPEVFERA